MSGSPGAGIDRLFGPSSLAIIGATDRPSSLGDHVLRNAMASTGLGQIHPVNPNRESVQGLKCFATVADIPDQVDLAFVLLPAQHCAAAVRDCGAAGVPFAIIGSSGFGEGGGTGSAAAVELAATAKAAGVRLLGPNTNGIWNASKDVHVGFNVSQGLRLKSGRLALLSQTGAMLGSTIAALNDQGAGLSYAVSTGNELDLRLHELLEFMLASDEVDAVGVAVDAIPDPVAFADVVCRANGAGKPVVLLQMGTSKSGGAATELHASRVADRAGAVAYLMDRLGIAVTRDFDSYLSALIVLGSGRRIPDHNRVLGVSSSGAGAALIADTGESMGMEFPPLSEDTQDGLGALMSMTRPHNPLDITGESRDPEWVGSVLTRLAESDPAAPVAYLITLLYEHPTDPRLTAYASAAVDQPERLFLACVPGSLLPDYMRALRDSGVLVYQSLTNLFGGLRLAWQAARLAERGAAADWIAEWRRLRDHDHASGAARPVVHDAAKALMTPFGVPFPAEVAVSGLDGELTAAVHEVGTPLALKLLSTEHLHKAASNALALGLTTVAEVRSSAMAMSPSPGDRFLVQQMLPTGLDLFLGYQWDDRYGGVLLLGAGGSGVEQVGDVATVLLPASREQVRAALGGLRMADTLLSEGPAGTDWDIDSLLDTVVGFIRFVSEGGAGTVTAAEVNPLRLLGRGAGALAVDVRAVLADQAGTVREEQ
jgi:acyl-CoA synthetase (NDP forming)